MKVTQASPQIPRQNLLAEKLLESLPRPLIFNIFLDKNGCSVYFNPFTGVVKKRVITPPSSESGVITCYPRGKKW